MKVCRWIFPFRLALIFTADLNSRHAPKAVVRIFARAADHQILFFVNQLLPVEFANFEIRCQLDGISRARFFAVSTEDAAREIDAKELRVTAPVLVFGGLQGDAIHRAGYGAEIAGNAPLAALRITRKNDPAPIAWRQIGLLFRILDRHTRLKTVQEDVP